MRDFILSAATEQHGAIEAALGRAQGGGSNPALLRELFECLGPALQDKHLSDCYAPGLIAAINSVCRNCSGERKKAAAALAALERVFREGDANIKAYAADAACLLKTPAALRFMLKASEDPQVLNRCADMEDHIDTIAGLIYSADHFAGLRELGRMLSHPAGEIRGYAAGRLLFFGEPGAPGTLAEAAHILLAEGARKGCPEALRLLKKGHDYVHSAQERPRGLRNERLARAACRFYERIREGGECAIPEECWRMVRPQVIPGGGFQRPTRTFANGPESPALRVVEGEKSNGLRR